MVFRYVIVWTCIQRSTNCGCGLQPIMSRFILRKTSLLCELILVHIAKQQQQLHTRGKQAFKSKSWWFEYFPLLHSTLGTTIIFSLQSCIHVFTKIKINISLMHLNTQHVVVALEELYIAKGYTTQDGSKQLHSTYMQLYQLSLSLCLCPKCCTMEKYEGSPVIPPKCASVHQQIK